MSDGMPHQRITGRKFLLYLMDQGIIQRGDYVRRVIIDADCNDVVRLYVERFGDDRVLTLNLNGEGLQVLTAADLHAQQKREAIQTLIDGGTPADVALELVTKRWD